MNNSNFNVWEGVYKSFDEIEINYDAFSSKRWQERLIDRLKDDLELYKNNTLNISNQYPFYTFMACLYSENQSLDILDIGGGLGHDFFKIIKALQTQNNIRYSILEDISLVEIGREYLSDFSGLSFYDEIPLLTDLDCIHMGSTLQYIHDWKNLFTSLCNLHPQYIILSDVFAEQCESFVTAQIYYDTKIPHWILNLNELLNFLESHNYKLTYKDNYLGTICGKEGPLPMDALPSNKRVEYTYNLVFKSL